MNTEQCGDFAVNYYIKLTCFIHVWLMDMNHIKFIDLFVKTTKFAKVGLASSVVWTSQVRLGSANSRGRENTSPVILQMEQQCTW